MSTPDGHSALQALQPRQRSSASSTRSSDSLSGGSRPSSSARSRLARPRVECSSSLVAMNDGHMVPTSSLRQTPAPLQSSTAPAKPPWRW